MMSWVTVKVPKAPQPLAWTTRSGMRSRFWWASFSSRCQFLHQHRAARAGGQAVLVVDHRGTGRGGHDGTSQGGVLGHGLFSVEVVGIPAHRDAGKGDVIVDAETLRSAGQ